MNGISSGPCIALRADNSCTTPRNERSLNKYTLSFMIDVHELSGLVFGDQQHHCPSGQHGHEGGEAAVGAADDCSLDLLAGLRIQNGE